MDQPAPILVPTGVYIRTIQFTSSHNLTIGGVLWQNYLSNTPDSVKRGVSLPDATSPPTPHSRLRRSRG